MIIMLKFNFPVFSSKEPCPLYGSYLAGKDETARSELLTIMRNLHPDIADSLTKDLSDNLHAFMAGIIQNGHVVEDSLRDMRSGFLGTLFNTRASQEANLRIAAKVEVYNSELLQDIHDLAHRVFPECLQNAIDATYKGDTSAYLRDISTRLDRVMRAKHTSPFEYLYPCG